MRRIGILLLVILMVLSSSALVYSAGEDDLRSRLIEVYIEVYRLGNSGINVSKIVSELNTTVSYIDQGRYDEASKLLDKVGVEVGRLNSVSSNILFWDRFWRWFTVAVLISIPILTYLFLPRIYMEIWYRLRRRWVVRR